MKNLTIFFLLLLVFSGCMPEMNCNQVGNLMFCLPVHGESKKINKGIEFIETRDGLPVEITITAKKSDQADLDSYLQKNKISDNLTETIVFKSIPFTVVKNQDITKMSIVTVKLETLYAYGYDGEYEYNIHYNIVNFNKAKKYYNYIFNKQ